MLSLVWLLLFAGGAVFLAYQRVSLRTATIVAAAALAAYSLFGYGSARLDGRALGRPGPARRAQHQSRCASAGSRDRSCSLTAACCPRCPTPSARRSKPARCGGTASCSPASPTGRSSAGAEPPRLIAEEQAFLDGPCEELCRDARRLGHHPSPRRSAAAGVGLPEGEGLLRDDHPEEVRRPRVLRVRAFLRAA